MTNSDMDISYYVKLVREKFLKEAVEAGFTEQQAWFMWMNFRRYQVNDKL